MSTPTPAAVRSTLAELVSEQVLTPEQADTVSTRLVALWTPGAPSTRRSRLVEVAGYLGGAMVLGGAAAIVVPTWDSFPAAARFGLAVVVTMLLLGGLVAARFAQFGDVEARHRLASALGVLAAGAAAIAAAVPATDPYEVLVGSIAALVVAVPSYGLVRGAPLLAGAWLASSVLVGDVLDRGQVEGTLPWGLAFAVVGALWLLLAAPVPGNPVREPGLAAALGGCTGFGAAEALITEDAALLTVIGLIVGAGFAAATFVLYVVTRKYPALIPVVLIALVVPASALAGLFDSVLVAGFAVVVIGALLLVAGGIALTTRRPVGQ
ncbi:DUF2157 domain-containing protein [Cryptosporangium phraense]|uniref:DUF2157 domain-containing protein n=1 Tax=Cryptosporangium phraense TaxID=2593070 RepID=A0A545AEJ9_9ACTN|nr:DUF2157 domain-containing protein [Cryptosporangium phraense]TQS39739.1 hypothetical protein FL583_38365 [Cryptosporangium phraense]